MCDTGFRDVELMYECSTLATTGFLHKGWGIGALLKSFGGVSLAATDATVAGGIRNIWTFRMP